MVRYFHDLGWKIHGMDNNMRADFFGPQGDTRWNQQRLTTDCAGFEHHELDLRNRAGSSGSGRAIKPDAVIHTAAQPSHDLAASRPFDDFDVNAGGTLNLLEAVRQACPESPFVHMSTNKVYGDAPNRIPLKELETRWEYDDPAYWDGITGESSPSTSPNIRCSERPRPRATFWCRNTDATSACRPAACAAAA